MFSDYKGEIEGCLNRSHACFINYRYDRAYNPFLDLWRFHLFKKDTFLEVHEQINTIDPAQNTQQAYKVVLLCALHDKCQSNFEHVTSYFHEPSANAFSKRSKCIVKIVNGVTLYCEITSSIFR